MAISFLWELVDNKQVCAIGSLQPVYFLSNSDFTIRIPLLITSVFVVLSFSEHSFNILSISSSSRNSNRLCLDLSDFGLGDTLIPPFLSVQLYYTCPYENVKRKIKTFSKRGLLFAIPCPFF